MMKRLTGFLLASMICGAGTCADAQTRSRGATASTSSEVGRRLERESLLPPARGASLPAWPLGRINGRLGQRVDSRLDLRLNGFAPTQRNAQSRTILRRAQTEATSDPQ